MQIIRSLLVLVATVSLFAFSGCASHQYFRGPIGLGAQPTADGMTPSCNTRGPGLFRSGSS